MKFAMVKFKASKNRDRLCAYESMLMEVGASPKWTRSFESEDNMTEFVVRLLARQGRNDDLRPVLDQIRNGGYYFFDLHLTPQEAESLGYLPDASIPNPQRRPTLDGSQLHPARTPVISGQPD